MISQSGFDPRTAEHLFHGFDSQNKGLIDFRDFVAGYAVLKRGDMHERLHFSFLAFDLDHSGFIDRDEMYEMMKSLC